MNVLLYFPVWGHVLCCAMMLACHEWGAAWFAAAAAYFAFCWLSKKPNVARVDGGAAARLRDDDTSVQPALLGGASPTGNAGEAAPHWADAKRPPSTAVSGSPAEPPCSEGGPR